MPSAARIRVVGHLSMLDFESMWLVGELPFEAIRIRGSFWVSGGFPLLTVDVLMVWTP
jgi:hypothetical protein